MPEPTPKDHDILAQPIVLVVSAAEPMAQLPDSAPRQTIVPSASAPKNNGAKICSDGPCLPGLACAGQEDGELQDVDRAIEPVVRALRKVRKKLKASDIPIAAAMLQAFLNNFRLGTLSERE